MINFTPKYNIGDKIASRIDGREGIVIGFTIYGTKLVFSDDVHDVTDYALLVSFANGAMVNYRHYEVKLVEVCT